jgi:hypothetical protein
MVIVMLILNQMLAKFMSSKNIYIVNNIHLFILKGVLMQLYLKLVEC